MNPQEVVNEAGCLTVPTHEIINLREVLGNGPHATGISRLFLTVRAPATLPRRSVSEYRKEYSYRLFARVSSDKQYLCYDANH
jgi:hypothetical protein